MVEAKESVSVTFNGKVMPDSALVGVIERVDVVALYHGRAGDKDIDTVWPSKSVIAGKPYDQVVPTQIDNYPGFEENVGAVLVTLMLIE